MTPLNLLIAYPYMKPEVIAELRRMASVRVLLDSGAFTAWKAGTAIKLDDYCRFIESLGDLPWRYFTLDVVGNPGETMKNYEIMLKRGFKPMPIFTRGEEIAVLEDYYATSDVVGIGGLVQTRGNKGFVKGIMRHVGKRSVHWLGFSGLPFVHVYRPYMCDSSSWASSLRYGSLSIIGKGLTEMRVTRAQFESLPSRELFNVFDWYGEEIKKLGSRSEWRYTSAGKTAMERMAFKSAVRRMLDIESMYRTKFFLAIIDASQARQMAWAFEYWGAQRPERSASADPQAAAGAS